MPHGPPAAPAARRRARPSRFGARPGTAAAAGAAAWERAVDGDGEPYWFQRGTDRTTRADPARAWTRVEERAPHGGFWLERATGRVAWERPRDAAAPPTAAAEALLRGVKARGAAGRLRRALEAELAGARAALEAAVCADAARVFSERYGDKDAVDQREAFAAVRDALLAGDCVAKFEDAVCERLRDGELLRGVLAPEVEAVRVAQRAAQATAGKAVAPAARASSAAVVSTGAAGADETPCSESKGLSMGADDADGAGAAKSAKAEQHGSNGRARKDRKSDVVGAPRSAAKAVEEKKADTKKVQGKKTGEKNGDGKTKSSGLSVGDFMTSLSLKKPIVSSALKQPAPSISGRSLGSKAKVPAKARAPALPRPPTAGKQSPTGATDDASASKGTSTDAAHSDAQVPKILDSGKRVASNEAKSGDDIVRVHKKSRKLVGDKIDASLGGAGSKSPSREAPSAAPILPLAKETQVSDPQAAGEGGEQRFSVAGFEKSVNSALHEVERLGPSGAKKDITGHKARATAQKKMEPTCFEGESTLDKAPAADSGTRVASTRLPSTGVKDPLESGMAAGASAHDALVQADVKSTAVPGDGCPTTDAHAFKSSATAGASSSMFAAKFDVVDVAKDVELEKRQISSEKRPSLQTSAATALAEEKRTEKLHESSMPTRAVCVAESSSDERKSNQGLPKRRTSRPKRLVEDSDSGTDDDDSRDTFDQSSALRAKPVCDASVADRPVRSSRALGSSKSKVVLHGSKDAATPSSLPQGVVDRNPGAVRDPDEGGDADRDAMWEDADLDSRFTKSAPGENCPGIDWDQGESQNSKPARRKPGRPKGKKRKKRRADDHDVVDDAGVEAVRITSSGASMPPSEAEKEPLAEPPAEPPAEPDLVGLRRVKNILTVVLAAPEAGPFKVPVNSDVPGCENYYEEIKNPMDLGTIHRRLPMGRGRRPTNFVRSQQDMKKYLTVAEVLSDVELVWQNCFQYNHGGDDICLQATACKNRFQAELEKVMPEYASGGGSSEALASREESAAPRRKSGRATKASVRLRDPEDFESDAAVLRRQAKEARKAEKREERAKKKLRRAEKAAIRGGEAVDIESKLMDEPGLEDERRTTEQRMGGPPGLSGPAMCGKKMIVFTCHVPGLPPASGKPEPVRFYSCKVLSYNRCDGTYVLRWDTTGKFTHNARIYETKVDIQAPVVNTDEDDGLYMWRFVREK